MPMYLFTATPKLIKNNQFYNKLPNIDDQFYNYLWHGQHIFYQKVSVFKKIEGGPELVHGCELVHHHYRKSDLSLENV